MNKEKMFQWVDAHKEEQLDLLKELAAIPAPSHHEEKRVAFICDWLKKHGVEKVIVDEALNVCVPFNCDGSDDITVYMAHTDVVFPDTDSLPVVEQDGKLFAPGVGDDTANVVSLMLCVKYLMEQKCSSREPVLIVFNSCEEGLGNLKGVRQIMADYAGRVRELVSFDGTYTGIYMRAVGSERWEVRVSTCGGHSYGAFGNPNAIAHLAGLIAKLYQQPVPQAPERKTTYNVGIIQGGTSVNTIAQDASMLYEYRSDDRESMMQMREQFLALVEETRSSDVKVELTLLGERPCGGNVPEEKEACLVQRCSKAAEEVTGIVPAQMSGSTDANIPLSLGVPAATFGMYLGAKAHTREEYIEIASLNVGLKIGMLMVTSHFDA